MSVNPLKVLTSLSASSGLAVSGSDGLVVNQGGIEVNNGVISGSSDLQIGGNITGSALLVNTEISGSGLKIKASQITGSSLLVTTEISGSGLKVKASEITGSELLVSTSITGSALKIYANEVSASGLSVATAFVSNEITGSGLKVKASEITGSSLLVSSEISGSGLKVKASEITGSSLLVTSEISGSGLKVKASEFTGSNVYVQNALSASQLTGSDLLANTVVVNTSISGSGLAVKASEVTASTLVVTSEISGSGLKVKASEITGSSLLVTSEISGSGLKVKASEFTGSNVYVESALSASQLTGSSLLANTVVVNTSISGSGLAVKASEVTASNLIVTSEISGSGLKIKASEVTGSELLVTTSISGSGLKVYANEVTASGLSVGTVIVSSEISGSGLKVKASEITGSSLLVTSEISGSDLKVKANEITGSSLLVTSEISGSGLKVKASEITGSSLLVTTEISGSGLKVKASEVTASNLSVTNGLTGSAIKAIELALGDNTGNGSIAVRNNNGNVFTVDGNGNVSGSGNATFGGNITVAGTGSFGVINYVSGNSVQIGDKYIVIASGAAGHSSLEGSGILFGSASLSASTTGSLGQHASILYRDATDRLEIFPGVITDNVTASALHVSGTTSEVQLDGKVLVAVKDLSFTVSGLSQQTSSIDGLKMMNVSGAFKAIDSAISSSDAARSTLSSSLVNEINGVKQNSANALYITGYNSLRAVAVGTLKTSHNGVLVFHMSGNSGNNPYYSQVSNNVTMNAISLTNSSGLSDVVTALAFVSFDVSTKESGSDFWTNDLVSVKAEATASGGTYYPKVTVTAPALLTDNSDSTKIRLIAVNENRDTISNLGSNSGPGGGGETLYWEMDVAATGSATISLSSSGGVNIYGYNDLVTAGPFNFIGTFYYGTASNQPYLGKALRMSSSVGGFSNGGAYTSITESAAVKAVWTPTSSVLTYPF